jgi:hypothetical protein
MQPDERRRYVLSDYTVEKRAKGWYFGRPYSPPKAYLGPYASLSSVTLMIARQWKKEVERRDAPRPPF